MSPMLEKRQSEYRERRPLNIALRVDSGKKIGMGHLVRMSALADAFSALSPTEVSFYQTCDEPVDYGSCDIVILDSYLLSDEYISRIHKDPGVLVCYDDNALYTYDCDVLLNANLHASDLSLRTASPPPIMLLGGRYALLRSEFWEAEPIAIERNAAKVFVCFGGTDLNNQTPSIVEALQMIQGLQLCVVAGKDAQCVAELRSMERYDTSIFIDPPSIASIMRECDLAIVSAGSIVYEVAALGIPALTIVQAENQCLVAEYLDSHGLMRNLGSHEVVDAQALQAETLDLLLDYNRRDAEARRLTRAVDKRGALNAASEIIEVFNATA